MYRPPTPPSVAPPNRGVSCNESVSRIAARIENHTTARYCTVASCGWEPHARRWPVPRLGYAVPHATAIDEPGRRGIRPHVHQPDPGDDWELKARTCPAACPRRRGATAWTAGKKFTLSAPSRTERNPRTAHGHRRRLRHQHHRGREAPAGRRLRRPVLFGGVPDTAGVGEIMINPAGALRLDRLRDQPQGRHRRSTPRGVDSPLDGCSRRSGSSSTARTSACAAPSPTLPRAELPRRPRGVARRASTRASEAG